MSFFNKILANFRGEYLYHKYMKHGFCKSFFSAVLDTFAFIVLNVFCSEQ